MKLIILIFAFLNQSHAFAEPTCNIIPDMNQATNLYDVENQMSDKLLARRGLQYLPSSPSGNTFDDADYIFQLDDISMNHKSMTLDVVSIKVMRKIALKSQQGKKCNFEPKIFGSFSYALKTPKRTAEALIYRLPPCDALKEMENFKLIGIDIECR